MTDIMEDMFKKIYDLGIVPVVAIDDAEKAVPLAKALSKGGLPAAEITFRTAAAEESIRRIVKECPDVLVGAGTVLTKEQADRAVKAGAKFIVTPGFNPEMVSYIKSLGVPMMPGCATPGEMEQAMSMGFEFIKFFPAEQNGGVAKLKAYAGPYKGIKWMPTGGVNTKNMNDYLSFDRILACGGTWIAKGDLIDGEKWDEISALCKDAIKTMLGFKLSSVVISSDDEKIKGEAELICGLLGLQNEKSESALKVEEGADSRIVISTLNAERAKAYIERMNVEICSDMCYNEKGKLESFTLKNKISNFAIQIAQL